MPVDPELYRAVARAGWQYGIPTDFLLAQLDVESAMNPLAVSSTGAQGIAQFMPGTWKDFGQGSPFDPTAATQAQARYMRHLFDMLGDPQKAASAYFMGPGNVGKPEYSQAAQKYLGAIEEKLPKFQQPQPLWTPDEQTQLAGKLKGLPEGMGATANMAPIPSGMREAAKGMGAAELVGQQRRLSNEDIQRALVGKAPLQPAPMQQAPAPTTQVPQLQMVPPQQPSGSQRVRVMTDEEWAARLAAQGQQPAQPTDSKNYLEYAQDSVSRAYQTARDSAANLFRGLVPGATADLPESSVNALRILNSAGITPSSRLWDVLQSPAGKGILQMLGVGPQAEIASHLLDIEKQQRGLLEENLLAPAAEHWKQRGERLVEEGYGPAGVGPETPWYKPEALSYSVGRAAPQTAASVAAAIAGGGPLAAGVVGGGLEASQTYSEAVEAGLTPEEAALLSTAAWVGTGALESLGIEAALGSVLKKMAGKPVKEGMARLLGRLAMSAAGEGLTEGEQQRYLNLLAQKTYDPERKLSEGVAESRAVGAILGTGTTAVGAALPQRPQTFPHADVLAAQHRGGGPGLPVDRQPVVPTWEETFMGGPGVLSPEDERVIRENQLYEYLRGDEWAAAPPPTHIQQGYGVQDPQQMRDLSWEGQEQTPTHLRQGYGLQESEPVPQDLTGQGPGLPSDAVPPRVRYVETPEGSGEQAAATQGELTRNNWLKGILSQALEGARSTAEVVSRIFSHPQVMENPLVGREVMEIFRQQLRGGKEAPPPETGPPTTEVLQEKQPIPTTKTTPYETLEEAETEVRTRNRRGAEYKNGILHVYDTYGVSETPEGKFVVYEKPKGAQATEKIIEAYGEEYTWKKGQQRLFIHEGEGGRVRAVSQKGGWKNEGTVNKPKNRYIEKAREKLQKLFPDHTFDVQVMEDGTLRLNGYPTVEETATVPSAEFPGYSTVQKADGSGYDTPTEALNRGKEVFKEETVSVHKDAEGKWRASGERRADVTVHEAPMLEIPEEIDSPGEIELPSELKPEKELKPPKELETTEEPVSPKDPNYKPERRLSSKKLPLLDLTEDNAEELTGLNPHEGVKISSGVSQWEKVVALIVDLLRLDKADISIATYDESELFKGARRAIVLEEVLRYKTGQRYGVTLTYSGPSRPNKYYVFIGEELSVKNFYTLTHELAHVFYYELEKVLSAKEFDAIYEDYLATFGNIATEEGIPIEEYNKYSSMLLLQGYDENIELTSGIITFKEFFADRVATYMTDPGRPVRTLADRLYKRLADGFRKIFDVFFGQRQELKDDLLTQFLDSWTKLGQDAGKRVLRRAIETGRVGKTDTLVLDAAENKSTIDGLTNLVPEVKERLLAGASSPQSLLDSFAKRGKDLAPGVHYTPGTAARVPVFEKWIGELGLEDSTVILLSPEEIRRKKGHKALKNHFIKEGIRKLESGEYGAFIVPTKLGRAGQGAVAFFPEIGPDDRYGLTAPDVHTTLHEASHMVWWKILDVLENNPQAQAIVDSLMRSRREAVIGARDQYEEFLKGSHPLFLKREEFEHLIGQEADRDYLLAADELVAESFARAGMDPEGAVWNDLEKILADEVVPHYRKALSYFYSGNQASDYVYSVLTDVLKDSHAKGWGLAAKAAGMRKDQQEKLAQRLQAEAKRDGISLSEAIKHAGFEWAEREILEAAGEKAAVGEKAEPPISKQILRGEGKLTGKQKAVFKRISSGAKRKKLSIEDYIEQNQRLSAKDKAYARAVVEKVARLREKNVEKEQEEMKELGLFVEPPADNSPESTQDYFDRSRKVASEARPESLLTRKQRVTTAIYKAFFEQSAAAERILRRFGAAGAKAFNLLAAREGATTAGNIRYDEAYRKVWWKLKEREREILNDLIHVMRVKSLYEGGKGSKVQELSHEAANNYISNFGRVNGLSPQKVADLMNRANEFFKVTEEILEFAMEEGLISKKHYEYLRDFDYSPRRSEAEYIEFIKAIDSQRDYANLGGKSKVSVWDSGVEFLSPGKKGEVFNLQTDFLLRQYILRIYGRALNNRAVKSLMEIAELPGTEKIVSQKRKPGFHAIHYRSHGKDETLYLHPELAEGWIKMPKDFSHRILNVLGWISGARLLRFFATGPGKPTFFVVNWPLDIGTAYLTALRPQGKGSKRIYSTFPIKGLGQVLADESVAVWDQAMDKLRGKHHDGDSWVTLYEKYGGMTDFLHAGSADPATYRGPSKLKSVLDAINTMNRVSEVATRVAITRRATMQIAKERGMTVEQAKKDKEIMSEAVAAARAYIDFHRGGWIAKSLDSVMPYTNAALQATRSAGRAARRDPVGFGIAVGWLVLAEMLRRWWLEESDPEFVKALEQQPYYDRNYYVYRLPEFLDKFQDGKRRHAYLTIRKDTVSGAAAELAKQLYNTMQGREADVASAAKAFRDFVPYTVGSIPMFDAWLKGAGNFELYRMKPVWYGYRTPPHQRAYTSTNQFYVDLAAKVKESTGMEIAPAQVQAAMQSFFTKDNIFANVFGTAYNDVYSTLTPRQKAKLEKNFFEMAPGVKRMIKYTNAPKWEKRKIKKIK